MTYEQQRLVNEIDRKAAAQRLLAPNSRTYHEGARALADLAVALDALRQAQR
jgi:hypothetical protein